MIRHRGSILAITVLVCGALSAEDDFQPSVYDGGDGCKASLRLSDLGGWEPPIVPLQK